MTMVLDILLLIDYFSNILQCKDICTDVQDSLLRDIKELNEQSKAYQYSCLNCTDAYGKLCKAREKVLKASGKRKEKREEQEKEVCRFVMYTAWGNVDIGELE